MLVQPAKGILAADLMDGDHNISQSFNATVAMLRELFRQLAEQAVVLEALVLKTNMVRSGKASKEQAPVETVAEMTVRCLRQTVPAAGDGLWAAIKADTLAVTAFEIGLFGWMIIFQLVLFHQGLHPTSPVYWFMMQIGMVLGFLISYPMNWWLLRASLKDPM